MRRDDTELQAINGHGLPGGSFVARVVMRDVFVM